MSAPFSQNRHKRNDDKPQSRQEEDHSDGGDAELNERCPQRSKDQKYDRVYSNCLHRSRSIPQAQESA
jgi:hypothetical protein